MIETENAGPALQVLSTGAPKTGVSGCARAFQERTGRTVAVTFVTAPVLRERIEQGEARADVIVSPAAVMDAFEAAGRIVAGVRAPLGSVRAGVVVRAGAPAPDISSAGSLKAAILAAESIVYNVATSGQYIAAMMDRLGVAEAIRDRTTLVPNGAAVMAHLAASDAANEIGFGQTTEILLHADRGVRLVGPLPAELENVTAYVAGVFARTGDPDAANALVAFMASGEGREICAASGLMF